MEDIQVNFEDVKPVETKSVDLSKYDKKEVLIESAVVTKVKSQFLETDDKMQYVLKVSSVPVESYGEGDEKIEFRASELFNLVQDEKGKLIGFPTGEGSNLMKFMKDLRIPDVEKLKSLKELIDAIIGKKALIRAYDKQKEGKKMTFLRFRY